MANPVPKTLIVGGGLGGLFLGILLDHAKIPYEIFERAPAVKSLGALMTLNVNILPVFEQLNLLDELYKISLPIQYVDIYYGDMSKIARLESVGLKERIGYDFVVFARAELYDLLLSKIPRDKIHFGKRFQSCEQTDEGVKIHFEDNSVYEGDILVGADGCDSTVRQQLFDDLKKEGKLSPNDARALEVKFSTLVGITNDLGSDFHKDLLDPFTHNSLMIGQGTPYTWSTYTIPGNRVCWHIQAQFIPSQYDPTGHDTEWHSDNHESMIDEVKHLETPYGTIEKLIEHTDKGRISKVLLEDKLFDTWYHGRTVLIGDGRKNYLPALLLPSSGQGAINAMQDAVILANSLYEIASVSAKDITGAFKDYKEQRNDHVVKQYHSSANSASIMYGQRWWERMLRHLVFNYLPLSVLTRDVIREASYRPQVTFLPQAPTRGTTYVQPVKSSSKYSAIAREE
ncbi:hypothetical protein BGZ76_008374 [Entomortierella beljakovae]|nr:hypothetical protein BGZ76_008374 [Entomortierella beljakovae]